MVREDFPQSSIIQLAKRVEPERTFPFSIQSSSHASGMLSAQESRWLFGALQDPNGRLLLLLKQ